MDRMISNAREIESLGKSIYRTPDGKVHIDATILQNGNNPFLVQNLKDSSGRNRFIEGNGTPSEITGFTSTYCRWSLSGSHLMLVLAGTFANAASLNNTALATFALPSWIMSKIFPVWSTYIEGKTIKIYNEDWSTQNLDLTVDKTANGIVFQQVGGSLTMTKERNFRIAFDLLIDFASE